MDRCGESFPALFVPGMESLNSGGGLARPVSSCAIDFARKPTQSAGRRAMVLLTRTDLCPWLRQAHHRFPEVHPASLGELQTEVDHRLEYLPDIARLRGWLAVACTACYRLGLAERLDWRDRQPSQIRSRQYHHRLRHHLLPPALCPLSRPEKAH